MIQANDIQVAFVIISNFVMCASVGMIVAYMALIPLLVLAASVKLAVVNFKNWTSRAE